MATTSLWAVRGTIRDVVAYVKDPNKTANPDYDLKNVLTYAADSSKTEKQYYVTGLNCSPHFAFERMTATKERYGKRGGIVGYHGYQSFKPGELTPEECHKIGVLTAKRMWGDRFEVIVATHVKGSSALHNHFVINSVSFKDGKKYRWQKGSYRQMRRVSDELCRQHQLSIIENPMPKKVPRQIWIAEKQGKVKMYKKLKERITENTQYYLLRNVHPRAEQPFQVRDDDEMQELVESIRMNGVLNPLIVTPRRGGYEIVSGHRRYAACQKLGVETVPVIVRDLDPDEATLCMIDSNLHREHLLPSEKAYAYKAKMEVLNRQGQRYGQTSLQPATKWDAATEIGKATNESRDQVFRYIRLTNLIKPLMDIVDSGRIAFTPAVELSYLPHELQDKIVEIFERDEATPSYAQTVRFRRLHSEGKLTADAIEDIMAKPKANQKETVKFSYERIARFFPPNYSTKQMEDAIVRILEERKREVGAMPSPHRRDDAERG